MKDKDAANNRVMPDNRKWAALAAEPKTGLTAQHKRDITRNPPDTAGFAVSVVPFTGFGNGKSPFTPAKSDRDLPLKRSTAEMRPICLLEGVPLP